MKPWGNQKILVRGLTGKERYGVIKDCGDANGMLDNYKLNTLLLSRCLCDPKTNERIFTDAQADQIMSKSAKALQDIIEVVKYYYYLYNPHDYAKIKNKKLLHSGVLTIFLFLFIYGHKTVYEKEI